MEGSTHNLLWYGPERSSMLPAITNVSGGLSRTTPQETQKDICFLTVAGWDSVRSHSSSTVLESAHVTLL